MNTIFLMMLLLLAACTGSSEAEESSENSQTVRYEGPVVYSNLPPPVLYFPSVPHPDRSLRQNGFHSRMQQASITKNAIEYVPFPYQDLPVLVYQSRENPPIHVVSNLQNGDKTSEEYKKTPHNKEIHDGGSTVVSSNGQNGVANNYYQQTIGNPGLTLNTGLEYQHVVIQLPEALQSETYGPQKESQNSNTPYGQSESRQYYQTPYENDVKSEYAKLSQQTYDAGQSHDNFPQPSQAYQTVAVIDYSQLMSSIPEHDSPEAGTGRAHESSPERTGYFWRQPNLPALRQFLHMSSPFSEGPQIPRPASSNTRYYHAIAPVNPLAALYDVSSRLVNPPNENAHKQNSMFSVSASDVQPLYVHPAQHDTQGNMMKSHPDSSAIVYQPSPSTVQHLYVQLPPVSDKSSRETKHVDNPSSAALDSYKQKLSQNQLHHSSAAQEVSDGTQITAKSPSYHVMSSQSHLKYGDTNTDASPLPHLVYTGHPPIHVFQHPIVIKVSDKGSENHLRGMQNGYGTNSVAGSEMKLPIGSIGNFGLFKPTFEKGSLDSINNLEQTNNNGDMGTQSVHHPEVVKSTGSLAEIFRQQADSYHGSQNYGKPEQGQLQTIALPIGIDSIAIYGGKFSPFGGFNRGYYNRFFIRNKSPTAGQGTNAAVLASRLFGRLAALGNTLLVNNLGLKLPYHHNLLSPHAPGTLTEVVNAQPVTKLENLHYTNLSSNRDSGLGSLLSERMSASHAPNPVEGSRTVDSPPKVQYKTPPTKATAAPQHHKPPIIIYKGIQPPVHVYGNEESIEKREGEDTKSESYETEYRQANVKHYELKDVQQSSLPVTQASRLPLPHANQQPYNPENFVPQTYSIPYDYGPSTFSNRASVDHEEFDHGEQTYHHAVDYPKEKSDLSWMPINFPHYTEAESIDDLTVPVESGENVEKKAEGTQQPSHQNDTSDTLQPRVDETTNAEEETSETKE